MVIIEIAVLLLRVYRSGSSGNTSCWFFPGRLSPGRAPRRVVSLSDEKHSLSTWIATIHPRPPRKVTKKGKTQKNQILTTRLELDIIKYAKKYKKVMYCFPGF